MQGGQQPLHAEHAGAERQDRRRRERGPVTGHRGDVGHPTGRGGDHILVPGQIPQRPPLPESGQSEVHQSGVERAQLLVADPQSSHRGGSKILDEGVGLSDEHRQPGPPGVCLQIGDHAPLAPVPTPKPTWPRPRVPPGGSILTTSAPLSASTIPAISPAMPWATSTTRNPSRARAARETMPPAFVNGSRTVHVETSPCHEAGLYDLDVCLSTALSVSSNHYANTSGGVWCGPGRLLDQVLASRLVISAEGWRQRRVPS